MELIKELRERSGAGMMDCKKALEEAGNDIEAAMEILRKKGIAKAAKRGDREAKEGIVEIAVNDAGNEGYIFELNSETDFVARNDKFRDLANRIMAAVKSGRPADLEALLALPLGSATVKEEIDGLSGTIGEKLGVKRFSILSAPTVGAYSHMGGKMGVLLALDQPGKLELAVSLAMQVAAANPIYVTPAEVPMADIEKEKEIEREILTKSGKPANFIEKILEGKINKYFEGVCLIKQEYIKDDKQKVEQLLNGVNVLKFERFGL
jgi:elongation factor Ts